MTKKRLLFGAVAVLLLLTPLFADGGVQPVGNGEDWSSLKTGEEVFLAACAACHGVRGKGSDPTMLGFEPYPPNFADCQFNTREPKNDWIGVASEGGPIKSFSPMMPAFGKVLTREQIEAAVSHIKGFCRDKKWPPGEFNLPKALNTGKAFPENEVAWSISSTVEEPVTVKAKFVVARRVGSRHQIEAAIPFAVQQVETTDSAGNTKLRWGEGAGDIALAWKGVLWHSWKAQNIASMTLDLFFPTGDEQDGISDGIFALEPALAMGQIIPKVGFLQLQGGAELSTDTDKKSHGVFWRGAFGRTFRKGGFGRAWSPMVEILGSAEFGDKVETAWDVVPQFQVALSRRQHIRLGTGLLIPMTDFADRQLKIMAYLVWDWYDGRFTEGWR